LRFSFLCYHHFVIFEQKKLPTLLLVDIFKFLQKDS
jgi:hypothetical protein